MVLQPMDRSSWHHFATRYGAALHRAGAPAPTVEDEVTRVLGARGVRATVMATPTALWVDVDGARVVRLGPGNTDLARQVELTRLGDRVADGLAPDLASAEIERVVGSAGPWPGWAETAAFVGVSGLAALVLGGSLNDAVGAGAVGWVVARLHRALASRAAWASLADGLAAFAAGAAAQLLAVGGVEPARAALASVIVLAPGMSLTTAASEVAGGHWTSGTSRAAGAVSTLVQLGAGLAIAAMVVPAAPAAIGVAAAPWSAVLAAQVFAPVLLAVLGRTRPVDVAPAVLVAWGVTAVAQALTGPAGALVGATLASGAGSALGAWRRVPPAVFQTPALFLLVPGSLGVDGLRRAIGGAEPALPTAWSVAAVVVALAAGTLLGSVVRDARRGALDASSEHG